MIFVKELPNNHCFEADIAQAFIKVQATTTEQQLALGINTVTGNTFGEEQAASNIRRINLASTTLREAVLGCALCQNSYDYDASLCPNKDVFGNIRTYIV